MSGQQELPRVSVVIPVRPTESESRVIESLREVDYPPELIEILVVRGTQPSRQRNLGIAGAAGEIVHFLDNDSAVAKDLFRTIVGHFQDPKVIGVGGPNLSTVGGGAVASAVDAVFCSMFGTAGIRARYSPVGAERVATEHDIIFCNLAIRKKALEKAGGLNEELYPNEENELFERLLETFRGSRFMYDPRAVVRRPRSTTIAGHFKQIFRYGIGRMKQSFYRFNALCALHMIPAAFLLYLLIVPWLGIWWLWTPAAAYGALVVGFSAVIGAKEGSPTVGALLLLLFPITHVAYGAGLLVGFMRYAFLRRRPRKGEAELFVVKKLGEGISDS